MSYSALLLGGVGNSNKSRVYPTNDAQPAPMPYVNPQYASLLKPHTNNGSTPGLLNSNSQHSSISSSSSSITNRNPSPFIPGTPSSQHKAPTRPAAASLLLPSKFSSQPYLSTPPQSTYVLNPSLNKTGSDEVTGQSAYSGISTPPSQRRAYASQSVSPYGSTNELQPRIRVDRRLLFGTDPAVNRLANVQAANVGRAPPPTPNMSIYIDQAAPSSSSTFFSSMVPGDGASSPPRQGILSPSFSEERLDILPPLLPLPDKYFLPSANRRQLQIQDFDKVAEQLAKVEQAGWFEGELDEETWKELEQMSSGPSRTISREFPSGMIDGEQRASGSDSRELPGAVALDGAPGVVLDGTPELGLDGQMKFRKGSIGPDAPDAVGPATAKSSWVPIVHVAIPTPAGSVVPPIRQPNSQLNQGIKETVILSSPNSPSAVTPRQSDWSASPPHPTSQPTPTPPTEPRPRTLAPIQNSGSRGINQILPSEDIPVKPQPQTKKRLWWTKLLPCVKHTP
ncbi:hypothetical protein DFS34DRAFT_645497 [Phlyctochytrium arcticum]|nr:hypothetical protein DFS34DRAFT_645497 [Phlyctochytrium arcticum]